MFGAIVLYPKTEESSNGNAIICLRNDAIKTVNEVYEETHYTDGLSMSGDGHDPVAWYMLEKKDPQHTGPFFYVCLKSHLLASRRKEAGTFYKQKKNTSTGLSAVDRCRRTRWETRIPDTSQKNGYRWIRSVNEKAFFDKLFSAYGLKEFVDEKHPHPLSGRSV